MVCKSCVLGVAALSSVVALAGSASAVVITDNPLTEAAAIGGLVPLNLSSIAGIAGATNFNGTNSISTSFGSSIPGAFTGSLTARVFGNNGGATGAGLSQVLIIYDYVGNGPDGLDTFEFGVNSGRQLDFTDLVNATQGTLSDLATAGQLSPVVSAIDNGVLGNNTMLTDFFAAGDSLGGIGVTETFSWYVLTNGAVKINTVDVNISNFGTALIQSLALVVDPGQPNLNVPAPGALGVMSLGFGFLGVRRRRA